MPFFEPPPPRPDEPAERRPTGWRPPLWDRPSEAVLGVVVPVTVLLARNDEHALALDELRAFPNGFTCSLVVLRNPMAPVDTNFQHRPMPMHPMMGGGPRLGFEFSDGSYARLDRPSSAPPFGGAGSVRSIAMVATSSTATPGPTNPFGIPTTDDGIPLQPVLVPRGGGGGGDRFTMTYWCFPLPPPGSMTIHADWPDQSIDEVAIPFDADRIRAAARDAVTLWEPDE